MNALAEWPFYCWSIERCRRPLGGLAGSPSRGPLWRHVFIKSRTLLGMPWAYEDGTLCDRDIGKMIELAIYPSVRRRRAQRHDPERSQQPGKRRYTCFFHFESTFQMGYRLSKWASGQQVGLANRTASMSALLSLRGDATCRGQGLAGFPAR
jgi:hypothetical protein